MLDLWVYIKEGIFLLSCKSWNECVHFYNNKYDRCVRHSDIFELWENKIGSNRVFGTHNNITAIFPFTSFGTKSEGVRKKQLFNLLIFASLSLVQESVKISINANSEAEVKSSRVSLPGKSWSCSFWWLCLGLALPSTTPTPNMAGPPLSTCLSGGGQTSLQSVSASWVPMALEVFRYVCYALR